MTQFYVEGPFEVPVQVNPGGKAITATEIKAFWQANPNLAKQCGCYIFGIRAAKGLKPLYVGKATKTFAQEVFTPHKLAKYMTALSLQGKGTPVLFFVCHPKNRGPVNRSNIGELERYLIQAGLEANANILNDQNTTIDPWSIAGVLRGKQGQPSLAAKAFKKMMGM